MGDLGGKSLGDDKSEDFYRLVNPQSLVGRDFTQSFWDRLDFERLNRDLSEVMKFLPRVALPLATFLMSAHLAIAQSTPSPQTTLAPQQREEVQKLVDREIDQSNQINDRVQQSVNNTFGWTTGLLNSLIAVLVAMPVLAVIVALILRSSIRSQLISEIKKQLEEETKKEVKEQFTEELQRQVEEFKQDLESLKSDFVGQLQDLFVVAQTEKEKIFQELSKITPSIIQEEFVAPEVHQKIQELTKQLEFLTSVNPHLALTANDYLKQADAFYYENRHDDAVESYEKALKIQPGMIAAWLGKAKVLRRMKRYDEALFANKKVLQLQPDHPKGLFGMGYTLRDIGRYEEAIATFDQSLKLQPNSHHNWKHRGYALTKLGRYDEAYRSFEKALKLKPTSGGTYYNRASYYLSLGDIDAALLDLQQAIGSSSYYVSLREVARTDPDFDSIREDDRFKKLMEVNHL